MVIQDIGATDEFRASPVIIEHEGVSLLNVPIPIDGASWGVLEADSSRQVDFNEDTVDFMMAAAFTVAAVLRREAAEAAHGQALAQAAADQQHYAMLAAETQHRTRNYFSLVLAVLSFQRPRAEDAEVRAMFDSVTDRVQAIALAHDQLDPKRHRSMVDVPVYLRALCGNLDQQFDTVAVELRADELELAPERAIALGLIVNELVTNSIKHAFDERGGSVSVGLKVGLDHGKCELTVADNGRGVEASAAAGGGTGTRLLAALARRVGGEMRRESAPAGTTRRIRFPMSG